MPFEISPEFVPTETETRFKKLADAMLRGCAITTPIKGAYLDGEGGACALGAMFVGFGVHRRQKWRDDAPAGPWSEHLRQLRDAYEQKYSRDIPRDNDTGMTREQIAARIAAL